MRKHINRFVKPMLDFVERELTAVLAVAVVLAFIFSQSMAADTTPTGSTNLVSQTSGVTIQNTDSFSYTVGSLFNGKDNSTFKYHQANNLVNKGNEFVSIGYFSIDFLKVPSGTYNVSVTGTGIVKSCGITFSLGDTQKTVTKNVTFENGANVEVFKDAVIKSVKFESPSALNDEVADQDTATDNTVDNVAANIALLPSLANIAISPNQHPQFKPVVVVTNAAGVAVNAQLTWKSSDTSTATVSNGVVTALKAGTVTITATVIGNRELTASASVTIKNLEAAAQPVIDATEKESTTKEDTTADKVDGFVSGMLGNLLGNNKNTSANKTAESNQAELDKLAADKTAANSNTTSPTGVSTKTGGGIKSVTESIVGAAQTTADTITTGTKNAGNAVVKWFSKTTKTIADWLKNIGVIPGSGAANDTGIMRSQLGGDEEDKQ